MKESDYKNPQWQRKRLEVMQAHGFKCEWCSSEDKELHTHHVIYEEGKYLWEYPDNDFMLLCKDCHKEFHAYLNFYSRALSLLNKFNRKETVKYIYELVDKQK